MAESVIKNPSAIITETPTEGVTVTKSGHIVTVVINKNITLTGTTWLQIATTMYPPVKEVFGTVHINGQDKIIGVDILQNGKILVMGTSSIQVLVRGVVTYITDK